MARWVNQLENVQVAVHYVMEATGVYDESLAYRLDEHQQPVSVILPKQFKAYANSLNSKSKTDRIDARILAQMGLERSLAIWQPASPVMKQLKQLCREKNTLKEEQKALKNQLHARIAVHFQQPGNFVFHCHNLGHGDDGMMLNYEVK